MYNPTRELITYLYILYLTSTTVHITIYCNYLSLPLSCFADIRFSGMYIFHFGRNACTQMMFDELNI